MSDQVEQVPQEANQPEEQKEEEKSSWPSMWKMLLAYVVITQVIGFMR